MNRLLLFIVSLFILTSLLCVPGSLSAQELVFSHRPTQVGDVAQQTIQCNFDAERSIRQQNQLIDSSKQQLVRKQDRRLTVLQIQNGRTVKAELTYGQSQTQIRGADDESIEATHPVANRSYLVENRNGELAITNMDGSQPTEEELTILNLHLETFGKPNPLAQFLNGKRIRIGQTVKVPEEVANELLGLTGNKGNTEKLVLRLATIKVVDGQRFGVFETLLRTSNKDENTMSLIMKGKLVVEASTCRTKAIALNGPVALSETRGPVQGRFMVSTNGTLNVSVSLSHTNKQIARKTGGQTLLR